MPLSVVSEAQLLPELWEISDSETREAASIFLERGAMLYGACNGAAGAGNVELRARRSGLRGVVRGESRQVYFLGFREGTPLCPCWYKSYLGYSIQDITYLAFFVGICHDGYLPMIFVMMTLLP